MAKCKALTGSAVKGLRRTKHDADFWTTLYIIGYSLHDTTIDTFNGIAKGYILTVSK